MKANKEPIIHDEELDELFSAATEYQDGSELADLLAPSWYFDSQGSAEDATDVITFLTDSKVKLPPIIEIDNGGYDTVWTLLPEKRVRAILNKVIEDEKADTEAQEKQDAEVAVVVLEKQLTNAKQKLASIKTKKDKSND